jgi:hypothetical protein
MSRRRAGPVPAARCPPDALSAGPAGRADSLNVAVSASILVYGIRERRSARP